MINQYDCARWCLTDDYCFYDSIVMLLLDNADNDDDDRDADNVADDAEYNADDDAGAVR